MRFVYYFYYLVYEVNHIDLLLDYLDSLVFIDLRLLIFLIPCIAQNFYFAQSRIILNISSLLFISVIIDKTLV